MVWNALAFLPGVISRGTTQIHGECAGCVGLYVVLRARRVHGPEHPETKRFEKDLETASEVV